MFTCYTNFTHYLIAILYPQVLWIMTSTWVLVMLYIATGSWVAFKFTDILSQRNFEALSI